MYIYPPLVKKILPSLLEVNKALKAANSRTDRDVRPLMSILGRLPEADMRLLGIMQTRWLAVEGFEYTITSDDESDKEQNRAKEIQDRFESSGMPDVIEVIHSAIFYGASAIHTRWENVDRQTRVVAKEIIPCTDLDVLEDESVVRLVTNPRNDSEFSVEDLAPTDQFIIARYNPYKATHPRHIGGILRSCLLPEILKHFNWQDWARFNELFAMPLRLAKYKRGTGPEEKAKALEIVEQLGTDAYAAVSEDIIVEFIKAVDTGSTQSYERLKNAINADISILILGQTLTTELADVQGSRAAAEVHERVKDDIMYADLKFVSRILTNQYVIRDYRLNYGEPPQTFPKFKFLVEDEAPDYEKNARTIAEIKTLKAQDVEIPLKKSEVYEKLGFTEPELGDEVI